MDVIVKAPGVKPPETPTVELLDLAHPIAHPSQTAQTASNNILTGLAPWSAPVR
jgi:hypothetical protein